MNAHEVRQVARRSNGMNGRPFPFQQQPAFVAHAAGAAEDGFDCGVDRFDDTDADGVVTVSGDPLDMTAEKLTEPFPLRQPLPAAARECSRRGNSTRRARSCRSRVDRVALARRTPETGGDSPRTGSAIPGASIHGPSSTAAATAGVSLDHASASPPRLGKTPGGGLHRARRWWHSREDDTG